jgi:hypothetical protein
MERIMTQEKQGLEREIGKGGRNNSDKKILPS